MTDGLSDWQDGEGETLAELHNRYAAWLRRQIVRRFGIEAADDLLQDTWLRLAGCGSLGSVRHRKGFLLRVASNLGLDAQRRSAFRSGLEPSALAGEGVQDASQAEALLLKQVILDLPQPLRDVFVLSRFGGLTTVQIAERLGIRPKTVEWRMTRALARCAAQLRR